VIKALIFDLDGTLVQTEVLKAESYARAAMELCQKSITKVEVIEAFKDVVGLSRLEVAQKLMTRFNLETSARARMKEYDVNTPWQVFIQVRMKIYESMLANPQILRDHLCPHNVELLKWAQHNKFSTGLATMSHYPQASRVLQILELNPYLNFIATRLLVAKELNTSPQECLVIEDSPSGVKAALAAGMGCIAVTTDFTREGICKSNLLDRRWIVNRSPKLKVVAKQFITENFNE
jgi:beta-phosphoglucomutase-like phosphatase (HAD superfamily)